MLGWILAGVLLAAAVITIYVSFLNKRVAREKLREQNMRKAQIRSICISDGVTHIKLDAIDTDGNEREVEFETDDYDESEIYKGAVIVV